MVTATPSPGRSGETTTSARVTHPSVPSTLDRAADVTRRSLPLAVVPAVAGLLSLSDVARALRAGPGGGVTFPFPTGLPTLWTYASLPGGPGGAAFTGPLSAALFVPLFLAGLLVTSALEAGFLGTLSARVDGTPGDFAGSVRRYALRIVGVNLVRFCVVLFALPFALVFPPLALVVVVVGSYLVYGLPFVVVTRDAGFGEALDATVGHATDGGRYAAFGFGHLLVGAVCSLALSSLVRLGLGGVVVGTVLVAVPAVFVAAYGLFVFRDLDGRRPATGPSGSADATST